MRAHHDHALLVSVLSLFVLLVVVTFLAWSPRLTGRVAVTAEGGQTTRLDVGSVIGASSWLGVAGELTPSGSEGSFSLPGGDVVRLNLSYGSFSNDTLVVASTVPDPDWSDVSAASLAEVDSWMGNAGSEPDAAGNTLTFLHNVTFGGSDVEAWSAVTESVSGAYVTSVLSDGSGLLFVTSPMSASGFDGAPTDFQLLLPVNSSGSVDVSFFVFEQYSPPDSNVSLACDVMVNLTASLASDNESVVVSWDDVPGASGYEVLYVNDSGDGSLDFSSPSVVPAGGSSSWTDVSPSDERFYRLRLLDGGDSCIANGTAGTLGINLTPEYNLVSTPFISEDDRVPEVLRSVDGEYSSLFEYDNDAKGYEYYLIVGESVFNTFNTIKPGRAYWIRMSADDVLRIENG
ncbi:hypothetical protein KY327_00105 [Candidatus Woesearchaeota archaeon]|nr:hypothetical protein [Candidatus Woesearchaeota archaeon]